MDCVGWVGHMFYRVAVISNGIGQVHRPNYLGDIQRREEQGGVLIKLSACNGLLVNTDARSSSCRR